MKSQRPIGMQFRAHFKIDLARVPTLDADLDALFQLRQYLRTTSPKLVDWFLGGNSREDSLLYRAFDEDGPTPALKAVLAEKSRREKVSPPMRTVGLWNGEIGFEGASIGLFSSLTEQPSSLRFETDLAGFLSYTNVLGTLRQIVAVWDPLFVSVEPVFYAPVFKDRPGVGWMLYLPMVLTSQQVPEARALVPVMAKSGKGKDRQAGTIIVSVTDEPFSYENPEHVQIANAIEIRLVDQDLLPRYAEL